MIMRNPMTCRYGHACHHTDTSIVGRDPQILSRRPPNLLKMIANLFGLIDVPLAFKSMFQLAFGHFIDEEKTYILVPEHSAAILTANMADNLWINYCFGYWSRINIASNGNRITKTLRSLAYDDHWYFTTCSTSRQRFRPSPKQQNYINESN